MKSQAKITLIQLTDNGNADTALERMPAFFERAAEHGSDLVVFPEYILGRKIPVTHSRVQKFCALARRHRVYAVAGLVEARDNAWSTTALLVDRTGAIIGDYRKIHPAGGTEPHYWPPLQKNDETLGVLGSEFKGFCLDFGTVGILQCYDGYFPEAWGCAAFTGAEILLWINGRRSMVEDAYCISAAHAYGCVVGANVSNGWNTGFAEPRVRCIAADGSREEMRLFPRIPHKGDACVHAAIDLAMLRHHRKHLRTMHQRRPELYGALTQPWKMWQSYPEIPWDYPECLEWVNKKGRGNS